MHLYALTLQRSAAITCTTMGNFSGPKMHEVLGPDTLPYLSFYRGEGTLKGCACCEVTDRVAAHTHWLWFNKTMKKRDCTGCSDEMVAEPPSLLSWKSTRDLTAINVIGSGSRRLAACAVARFLHSPSFLAERGLLGPHRMPAVPLSMA